MAELGTKENPFESAPPLWCTEGLPYGAWCVCVSCGWLGRSTNTFDYYAKGPGCALTCERCSIGTPYAVDILVGGPVAEAAAEEED